MKTKPEVPTIGQEIAEQANRSGLLSRDDWLDDLASLIDNHQRVKQLQQDLVNALNALAEVTKCSDEKSRLLNQPPRSPEEQAAAIRRKVGCKGNIMSEGAGLYAGDLSTPPRSAEDKQ